MGIRLMRIDNSSYIRRNPNQIFSEIDREVVMLNTKKSEYYGLNKTASIIWSLIESPLRVNDLITILVSKFEISADICYKNTLVFLSELLETGVILVENDKNS